MLKNGKYNILIIDDDTQSLTTFKTGFQEEFNLFIGLSASEGFTLLKQNEIHLVVTDQRMAGLSGIEFLKKVKKYFPKTLRILLTGYSDLEVVVKAINECNIHRYMTKPWKKLQMKNVLDHALEFYQLREDKDSLLEQLKKVNQQLEKENTYLTEEINQDQDFQKIITSSEKFKATLKILEQVATTNTTVLIQGESGTGKELLAREIHSLSKKSEKPLVKVNCAALPKNLIESELFGHEKGAFTGASQQRIGRFEVADEGTIFLDEIGELPIDLQAKLLRILQDGEFERLGGNTTIKSNARIIAATNIDLEKAIKEDTFREDLYFRLNVFPITSPPLRERKEDIPILIEHFLKKHQANIGRKISTVPAKTLKIMMSYNYPGNIRELENLTERFMITSLGEQLEIMDWNPTFNLKYQKGNDEFLTMKKMEIRHITEACIRSDWKIFGEGGAAEKLEINAKTLSSRMSKLNIKKENSFL